MNTRRHKRDFSSRMVIACLIGGALSLCAAAVFGDDLPPPLEGYVPPKSKPAVVQPLGKVVIESKPVIEPETTEAVPLPAIAPVDRTLLVFTAKWCGPCRRMENGPLKALTVPGWSADPRHVGLSFKIRSVDIDADKATARQYGVVALPTLVALADGVEIDRHVGSLGTAAAIADLFHPGEQPLGAALGSMFRRTIDVRQAVEDKLRGQSFAMGSGTLTFASTLKVTMDPVTRTVRFSPPAVANVGGLVGKANVSGVTLDSTLTKAVPLIDGLPDVLTIDLKWGP